MAKKKIIRRKAPARVRDSQTLADAAAPLPRKVWTFLIYMCGDDDVLERFIDEDFAEMCRVGSQPEVHVVVQRDRREGARRYVLPEGPSDEKNLAADKTLDNVRVNTGEPAEALKFFLWGIERAFAAGRAYFLRAGHQSSICAATVFRRDRFRRQFERGGPAEALFFLP